MQRVTRLAVGAFSASHKRARLLFLAAVVTAFAAFPSLALAVETPSEEKIKTVASSVGSEGVSIILVVLGALSALIAMVIILPKAIKMIKRFL